MLSLYVIDFQQLGGEGGRPPVSYAYVQQDPAKALSERIQREYAVMEMPEWRWMLLVLLLGGQSLETPGIAVAKGPRDHKAVNLSAGRPPSRSAVPAKSMLTNCIKNAGGRDMLAKRYSESASS